MKKAWVSGLGAGLIAGGLAGVTAMPRQQPEPETIDYRIIAASRTSTMEKELNQAAGSGFRFVTIMGGDTAVGGKESVAIVARSGRLAPRYQYRLLATKRTSTMQKELAEASEAGYEFRAHTVFDTTFGGNEVVAILEKDTEARSGGFVYRLLATNRTSTMEKELKDVGAQGYEVVGMTVGQTAIGGRELVTITRRRDR
jgi:hypothetical protein